MARKSIADQPKANSNGFAKNPQNINRRGRPVSLVKKLRKKLLDEPDIADELINTLIGIAKNPLNKDSEKLNAIKELFDRVDGKPIQTVDTTSSDGTVSVNVRKWVDPPTKEENEEE